jgi:hypothetical protein
MCLQAELIRSLRGRVFLCTPVISALGREKQDDWEFKATVGYVPRPCLKKIEDRYLRGNKGSSEEPWLWTSPSISVPYSWASLVNILDCSVPQFPPL